MAPTLPIKKRPLTEQQVLKQLDIPDFRHLSKDKVMQFCTMLDRMDPEVAKAAIAQFPDFAMTVRNNLGDLRDSLKEAMTTSSKDLKNYFESCDKLIDSLLKTLDNGNLSEAERLRILEQIANVHDGMAKAGSEQRKLIEKIVVIAGGVAAVAITTAGALLGGNTNFKLPNSK